MTGKVTLDATNYKGQDLKQANFIHDVTERLSAQPGVVAAAAVFPAPFASQMHPSGSFRIAEKPTGPNDPGPHGDKGWATPGYLAAMQIPLLEGRWFSEADRKDTPPVAVIDDMLAKAYWPGRSAVGGHLRLGGQDSPPVEIVGVIGHVRKDSLEVEENKGVIYRPMAQQPVDEAVFVVRTKMNPDAMRTPLVEAVRAVDSTEAVYDVETLGQFRWRFAGGAASAGVAADDVWRAGVVAGGDWDLWVAEFYGFAADDGDWDSDGAGRAAVAGGFADAAGVDDVDWSGNRGGACADVCRAADTCPFVCGDGYGVVAVAGGCCVLFAGGGGGCFDCAGAAVG